MVRDDAAAGEGSWRCSRFPECSGRRSVADTDEAAAETITPILRRPRPIRPPAIDPALGSDATPTGERRRRPTMLIVLAVGVVLVLVLWAAVTLMPQERGYRVVCADGWVSYSGGIQGACSDHGGIRR